MTLKDGASSPPDKVLGDEQRGEARPHRRHRALDSRRQYVADADALVIESTFLDDERHLANDFGHITARQVAALAAKPASRR
ncbi:MAG: hypothetical protein U0521_23015 [Anaerolineae bacterium]